MTTSSYLQPSLAPTTVTAPDAMNPRPEGADDSDRFSVARGERADTRWFVRVVLAADTSTEWTVRVIIDDRETRRILLHTVWSDWHDVPILAAHIPNRAPMPGSLESAAGDLAGALLSALQHDARGCLQALGTPTDSPLIQRPGRQERAALRNTRDAKMLRHPPQGERRQR